MSGHSIPVSMAKEKGFAHKAIAPIASAGTESATDAITPFALSVPLRSPLRSAFGKGEKVSLRSASGKGKNEVPAKGALTKKIQLERNNKIRIPKCFGSMEEIIRWYDQGFIGIHQLVWLRVEGSFENGNEIENPLEIQLQWSGFWKKLSPLCQLHNCSNGKNLTTLLQTTPGRVLLNNVLKKRKNLKT
jgi:hypothetical protein